jgi:hypothetical protein
MYSPVIGCATVLQLAINDAVEVVLSASSSILTDLMTNVRFILGMHPAQTVFVLQ